MKKFFMTTLACLSLAFACAGFAACGGNKNDGNNSSSGPTEEVSDFTFRTYYVKDNASYAGVCVEKYTGTDVNVVIPDTYNGQPVVAIGDYFFDDYYQINSSEGNGIKIKSVSMPDTIEYIERSAFIFSPLERITLSNNLTYVGDSAFQGCSNLQAITLPAGITSIANGVFHGCSKLQEVDIPEGITSIGSYAFAECPNLQQTEIPKEVKTIGEYAFLGCDKIKWLELPEGLTTIQRGAFIGCTNLMQAILPSTLTSLGENIFGGYGKLVEIVNKSSINNVSWGTTVEQVLSEEPAQSNFIDVDGCIFYDNQGELSFINYTGTEKEVMPSTETLNNRSFKVRNYALMETTVKYFNTSNRATVLEDKAFYQSDIVSLVIGENVSSICRDTLSLSMLYDWNYAVEIVNLSSLTWIEETCATYQKRACAQYLTSIPATSNFFEQDGAIYYKKGTKIALVDGEFGEWGGEGSLPRTDFDYVLDMYVPWLTKLTVPNCVILEKPKFSSSYLESIDEVILEEGITSIPEQYFWSVSRLKKLSIPDSITTVGKNAFSSSLEYYEKDGSKYLGNANNPQAVLVSISDTSATEITIGGDIKAVAGGVFENCENLTTVYWYLDGEPSAEIFGEKLATLTFKYHNIASTTTSYTIPTGIKTLKYQHLEGASSIKELVIPASVSKIEEGALKDLTALEKITLPATGTDYGRIFGKLFGQKTGSGIYQQMQAGAPLVEYGIPSTLTEIVVLDGKVSDYYFNGCKNITKANFDTITEIGEAAFVGTGFTAITLADGLTELGNSAFANCTSLQTVVLPKTAEAFKMGEGTVLGAMFTGCTALRELTLPDVQVISSQSFDNVSGLTVYYYNEFTILDATAQLPTYLQKEDCFSNVVFVKK